MFKKYDKVLQVNTPVAIKVACDSRRLNNVSSQLFEIVGCYIIGRQSPVVNTQCSDRTGKIIDYPTFNSSPNPVHTVPYPSFTGFINTANAGKIVSTQIKKLDTKISASVEKTINVDTFDQAAGRTGIGKCQMVPRPRCRRQWT